MVFYHGKYGAIALCMTSVFYTRWSSINPPGFLSIVHTDLKQLDITNPKNKNHNRDKGNENLPQNISKIHC